MFQILPLLSKSTHPIHRKFKFWQKIRSVIYPNSLSQVSIVEKFACWGVPSTHGTDGTYRGTWWFPSPIDQLSSWLTWRRQIQMESVITSAFVLLCMYKSLISFPPWRTSLDWLFAHSLFLSCCCSQVVPRTFEFCMFLSQCDSSVIANQESSFISQEGFTGLGIFSLSFGEFIFQIRREIWSTRHETDFTQIQVCTHITHLSASHFVSDPSRLCFSCV